MATSITINRKHNRSYTVMIIIEFQNALVCRKYSLTVVFSLVGHKFYLNLFNSLKLIYQKILKQINWESSSRVCKWIQRNEWKWIQPNFNIYMQIVSSIHLQKTSTQINHKVDPRWRSFLTCTNLKLQAKWINWIIRQTTNYCLLLFLSFVWHFI